MQTSKKITKSGGITIPRAVRQETGIFPGVPVDIITEADEIRIVKRVPVCYFCGSVDNVKGLNGKDICRSCAGKIAEVVAGWPM